MNTIVNNNVFAGLAAKGVKTFGAVRNGVVFHLTIYVLGDNQFTLVDERNLAFKIIL